MMRSTFFRAAVLGALLAGVGTASAQFPPAFYNPGAFYQGYGGPTMRPMMPYGAGPPMMAAPSTPFAGSPIVPGTIVGEVPLGPSVEHLPGPVVGGEVVGHEVAGVPAAKWGPRFDVDAEGLLWWVSRSPQSVPLLTTGTATSLAVLGRVGTQTLYGTESVDYGAFLGFRVGGAAWLHESQNLGVMLSYFQLGSKTEGFAVGSSATGTPILGQPVNIAGVGEGAFLLSRPGDFAGGAAIDTDLRMYGYEANVAARIADGPAWRFHGLLGFRSIRLAEQLDINAGLAQLSPAGLTFGGVPLGVGAVVGTRDSFGTANTLYAPQVGGRLQCTTEKFGLELTGKVAAGVMNQTVRIDGFSALVSDPAVAPVRGGIYALSSNIGVYRKSTFGVAPEAAAKVMYLLSPGVRVSAGYSALYLNDVIRPGNTIDRTINAALVPSDQTFGTGVLPQRPEPLFRSSSFWAHGANLGLELSF